MEKQVFISFVGKVKNNVVQEKVLTIHNITLTDSSKKELCKYTAQYICDEIGKNNFVPSLDDGKDIVDHPSNNYVMTWGRDKDNFIDYNRIELWWVYEETLRGWIYNTKVREKAYVGYFECVNFDKNRANINGIFENFDFVIQKTEDAKIIQSQPVVLIDNYTDSPANLESVDGAVKPLEVPSPSHSEATASLEALEMTAAPEELQTAAMKEANDIANANLIDLLTYNSSEELESQPLEAVPESVETIVSVETPEEDNIADYVPEIPEEATNIVNDILNTDVPSESNQLTQIDEIKLTNKLLEIQARSFEIYSHVLTSVKDFNKNNLKKYIV